MADRSKPATKAPLVQAASSSETAPALNKAIAKDTAAGELQDLQNPSQHHFPLLELPTELRLMIFRLVFQDLLNVITSPANTSSSLSATELTRGALALLDTCQTLRAESIDAMQPLANASQSSLRSLKSVILSRMDAIDMKSAGVDAAVKTFLHLEFVFLRLMSGMSRVAEVCSVLADARGSNKRMGAG